MNTPVHSLLRALDALGIQSIGFRVLSHGKCLRHTSPVALAIEPELAKAPVPRLSISDLFAAYALTPRKGEYVLNIEDGRLAYLPEPAPKVAKPIGARANPAKFSRAKAKTSRRHSRHVHTGDRIAA